MTLRSHRSLCDPRDPRALLGRVLPGRVLLGTVLLGTVLLGTVLGAGCTVVGGVHEEFRVGNAPPPVVTPDEVAWREIEARDIGRHVRFLASDARLGRGTPGPGLERSAAWLARAFHEAGLEPAGDDGGFLQFWPYERVALLSGAVVLEGAAGRLEHGRDFAALPSERGGAGDLVYLGPAVDAPDSMAAAAGRIAVVLLPGATQDAWRWPVTVRRSQITAARADALGVVFVLDPAFDEEAVEALATQLDIPTAEPQAVPLFFVREEAAASLVRGAGGDLAALMAASRSGDRRPVVLGGGATRVLAPASKTAVQVPNVVGRLAGSDPERAEEFVIFVAHYDHLGVGEPDESGDSIYNGADDNASGVAALVEVARAFGALPARPARPVLFLAVSGEEHGLLGSTWFATNPTVFLSDAVAALNMDMIGRNHADTIGVVGYGHSGLGPLIADVAAATPRLGLAVASDPGDDAEYFARSDHFAFARRGIPAVNLFSGLHDDYHTPSDEASKVDYDKVARVARLAFLTAHRLASEPITLDWTDTGRAAIRQ